MALLMAPLPAAPKAPASTPQASLPVAQAEKEAVDCLSGQGYLKARIRGALTRDLDWHQGLSCEGESRPDGSGVRLSFAGPRGPGRLHLIFGVRGVREGQPGQELPVNLTVLEDGGRIFATRGEDKCTLDTLRQQRETGGGHTHTWRLTGRGFCTDPVNALSPVSGKPGRIVVSRFDFVGVVTFAGGL